MKKSILSIFFLLSINILFCQTPTVVIDSVPGEEWESVFENLDKTKIETGILYDKKKHFFVRINTTINLVSLSQGKQVFTSSSPNNTFKSEETSYSKSLFTNDLFSNKLLFQNYFQIKFGYKL